MLVGHDDHADNDDDHDDGLEDHDDGHEDQEDHDYDMMILITTIMMSFCLLRLMPFLLLDLTLAVHIFDPFQKEP